MLILRNDVQSSKLVFVSGLRCEAAIAGGPEALAICGGAETLLRQLAAAAAFTRLTISFGICGGLDPALRTGDVVVGTHVVADGVSMMTDQIVAQELAARLAAAGERVSLGVVAGVDAPVLTRLAKAELRRVTEASSVEMESQIAARFTAARNAPFAVLRVVCDPAHRELPHLVTKAMKPDGGINVRAVAFGAMTSPAQTASLITATRETATAFATLRRCRRLPGLFQGLGLAHV